MNGSIQIRKGRDTRDTRVYGIETWDIDIDWESGSRDTPASAPSHEVDLATRCENKSSSVPPSVRGAPTTDAPPMGDNRPAPVSPIGDIAPSCAASNTSDRVTPASPPPMSGAEAIAQAYIPDGWTRTAWVDRLRYMATICMHTNRTRELNEWADRIELN